MKNRKPYLNKAGYKENFEIGSSHWFNTLNGQLARIASYILNTENPKMYLIEEYAKIIQNISFDFAVWRENIDVPIRHVGSVIKELESHVSQSAP